MKEVDMISHNIAKILYLTLDDTKSLGFSDYDFYNCVSDIFLQHGLGEAKISGETWVSIAPEKRFRFASCVVAKSRISGAKWSAAIMPEGKTYLSNNSGIIILNDNSSGLPIAFMDSYYISARCRAAACAVYAKHLARRNAETVSIIGLSDQNKYNVNAMRLVLGSLRKVRLYDPDKKGIKKFAKDLAEMYSGQITVCRTLDDALVEADVVMIAPGRLRQKLHDQLLPREGTLIIASSIDVLDDNILNRMDKIVADELPDQEFPVPLYALQGEVSAKVRNGRETDGENILVVSNGLVVQEIYIGSKMYELAQEKGIGIELDPIT